MREIVVQLCMALIGSLGFSMLFHLRGKLIFYASIGGMLSWAVYVAAVRLLGGIFFPCFWAAAFAAFYADLLARLLKAPSTVFFIPAAVPLIPGSNLYYTLFYIVRGDVSLARENALKTGKYALAIAVGLSLISAALHMWREINRSRVDRLKNR